MSASNSGSCNCGSVKFKTNGSLRGVVYCHCSQCRKQTGLFYAATDIEDENIQVSGLDKVTWYAASDFARRGFCSVCGSALFWKRNDSSKISIMAGAFENPSELRSECHIFVADKGDFYEICDGLPQFDRSTPSVPVAEE